MKPLLISVMTVLLCASCSGNNDNAHTTATTVVPPPPRQVLRAEKRPSPQKPAKADFQMMHAGVDLDKPLLILNLEQKKTIREGEEVVIDFSLANAKLIGDGGEYRVRYGVDDDDMQWIDHWEQVALTGWLPGMHVIRLELVGPDGWPYLNGMFNVSVCELTVEK